MLIRLELIYDIFMCVSMASRTRSSTKISPMAYVSGTDVEMMPVDLATRAGAA